VVCATMSTSRPFKKSKSGRIAVKVINHLGDEVMKVFSSTLTSAIRQSLPIVIKYITLTFHAKLIRCCFG
jgi:hypothetical protein